MKEEYEAAINEFIELRNMMIEDLEMINELLINDPLDECLRRVFVRTLYSFIETTCYIWKQSAYIKDKYDIASGKIKEPNLSAEEISMILEESYYIGQNGEAKIRPNYPEATRNLKFAIKVFAKTRGLDLNYVFGDKGWTSYIKGLQIRNRLTHPKAALDLFISEDEHEIINEVFDWFFGTIIFMGVEKTKIH